MQKQFWTYILASGKYGTLYIGVTNDLPRRIFEHKSQKIEGFTKKYKVTLLVFAQSFDSINEAIAAEKQFKKWNRSWKIKLIESINPDWNDLYDHIANLS